MKKQKVLFLITKSSWGGAQRYVFDLATGIDKEKYEPIIALGGKEELYDRLREAGLHVILIKGLSRDISLFKDIISSVHILLILLKEKPDVLHINSSKVGLLGALLGRLTFTKKIIFTSHGWAFNEDRPDWQKIIIKCLHWITVLLAHTTVVVSSSLKRDLNWPWVSKKMLVIPLGRAVSDLKPRADARELLAMKITDTDTSLYEHRHDLWLGTIAELHPTKCIDTAIKAVAILIPSYPTLRYVIIHDGEERERLEKLVAELNLKDHVFFTGTIPEAARLLTAFDVFVLPSRSEAFGYVLIEAGHAGLPVVATNVGGIPDIITDGENGLLVEPQRPKALAQALDTLFGDEELRTKLAKNHQNRVSKYTLNKLISATVNTYEAD